MILNTLDNLIDDIISEARNNNVSESESITRIQIEQWIHQYRALLIKQDIDKGRYTNPSYIQSENVEVFHKGFDVNSNISINKSGTENSITTIPKTIDLHFKPGITGVYRIDSVSGVNNEFEIQLVPNSNSVWRKYKKYSGKESSVSIIDDVLIYRHYYKNTSEPDTSTSFNMIVRGIFEDPSKVSTFKSSDVYPIPANMIPTLKQLIFEKEFKVTLSFPSDDKNNSNNELKNTPQTK